MVQISVVNNLVWAIDQNQNIWTWGQSFVGDSVDDRNEIYGEGVNFEDPSQPKLINWFKMRELKVLEVKSGLSWAVLKV